MIFVYVCGLRKVVVWWCYVIMHDDCGNNGRWLDAGVYVVWCLGGFVCVCGWGSRCEVWWYICDFDSSDGVWWCMNVVVVVLVFWRWCMCVFSTGSNGGGMVLLGVW